MEIKIKRVNDLSEQIIKSKIRVQKHGEVFTPKKIVNKMLNVPEIKEACEDLTTTFLEPAAGEGAFLIEILDRKLNMVSNKYNDDLLQYENYSLLCLSTLYGIELLEDNAQICVMNMFQRYYDHYKKQIESHQGKINQKVLNSAKKIISLNIGNGNFLTRKTTDENPLIFSEWRPLNIKKTTKNLKIQRTEYTFDEIFENRQKETGVALRFLENDNEQIDIFELLSNETELLDDRKVEMRYLPVKIIDVYKEEMEIIDEKNNH